MTSNEKQPTAEYLEARAAFLELVKAMARRQARIDLEEEFAVMRAVDNGEIGGKQSCRPRR